MALLNNAGPVTEIEFARILNSDNVAAPAEIHLFNESGERCALAAAGRAGHQDEPAGKTREVEHLLRQVERLEGWGRRWNHANRDGDRASLIVHIQSEAPDAIHGQRQVEVA